MNTFYFDTGVTPNNNPNLWADQVWRNGTKQIPFDADAPKNARLLFLCPNSDLPESKIPGVIVREVFNTSMCSKYAYFSI
jgi:hypothetical protein